MPQNINKWKSQTSMPPPPPRIPSKRSLEENTSDKNPSSSRSQKPRSSVHENRMVIAESFRGFKSYSCKYLPPFDEWNPNAWDLYVATGFNDTIRFYESAISRRISDLEKRLRIILLWLIKLNNWGNNVITFLLPLNYLRKE